MPLVTQALLPSEPLYMLVNVAKVLFIVNHSLTLAFCCDLGGYNSSKKVRAGALGINIYEA
jgi:hypothetical protein